MTTTEEPTTPTQAPKRAGRPPKDSPAGPGIGEVKVSEVKLEDWPQTYELTLKLSIDRPALDAAAGSPDALDGHVGRVLSDAVGRFMETRPAEEYTNLLATRAALAEKYAAAASGAAEHGARAKAARSAAEADAASTQAEDAAKRAARYESVLEDLDGKLAGLRLAVARGQFSTVSAAYRALETDARQELADLVRRSLFADPGRAMILLGVASGYRGPAPIHRALTIRDMSA